METRKDQILIFNQESSIDDKSLKFKIYNYFYLILKSKKEISSLILSFLIILEAIQLISYAFTDPHLNSWKIDKKAVDIISIVLGSIRISPLMKYVSFQNYLITAYCLLGVIFLIYIILLIQILANSSSSKQINGMSFIRIVINIMSIFLYTPITELFLLPLKCENGKIIIIADSQECGSKFYYLYVVIGIIGALLLFLLILFFLIFYFYPFYESNLNRKLNPTNDIFLHIIKLIYILRLIYVKDEYFSIVILLICSLFIIIKEFYDNTYCNSLLKIIVNIRNISVFWTYFILFLSKICYNSKINGIIYLLFFSYPLIIYFSILKIKREEIDYFLIPMEINDINYLIKKTKILINMIESEIEENNTLNKSSTNKKKKKSEIFLYGYIKMHAKTCPNEECPLLKYLNNKGNYNFQKQCLLSYMSIHFNTIIKNFPKNSFIRIQYIHFNYTKRYNLNSVRINLAELKKIKVTFQEEFVIFCMEQDIKEIDSKVSDIGVNGNTFDNELIDQKYLKLKYLIENTTKLYVEFWSIFSGNITNLNTNKLNTLGTKLNNYLKEINNIWENDLKNRNTDFEHQGIVLLYSKFLKEILWNNKKSEEISKKINSGYYYRNDTRKAKIGKKSKIPNIDSVIENQDHLLFANSNEKGICKIIQCSYSILYFLGYEKKELIRKPIEVLMPTIFVEGHKKMLEERIKKMISSQSSILDSSRNVNKKQTFIILRNKIGYLLPMNASFTIYDDSDYSNTYIIKAKMEPKDSKSMYAYYILTKPDFTIDSISSSALNLGLSMDLLKKYLVKMSILIRTKDDEPLNLFEKYEEFEDEPKQIMWVYPHIIYPKDNNQRNKEINLQDLITHSPKGRFLLQMNSFRYNNDKIIGFSFKITELSKKERNNKNFTDFIPRSNHEIMFDLLNLNYIRTVLVKKKTGLRNLRDREKEEESLKKTEVNKKGNKKKNKKGPFELVEESSEEENKKEEVVLTKEKILELQGMDSNYIKNFIFSLKFNGNDVSLEKHRPNKEKYPAGKITEPHIKIEVSHFIKRMEEKILSDPYLLKKLKNSSIQSDSIPNINIDNNEYLSSPLSPKKENNKEELGREISDVSSVLSKLFDDSAIQLFIIVSFCMYIYMVVLSSLEFALTYRQMNKVKMNLDFFRKGADLMNIMLYTKYFLTEAVIANFLNSSGINYIGQNGMNLEDFNSETKKELSSYHQKFSEIYNSFSSNLNKFSKEYRTYMEETNMLFYSLANENPVSEYKQFSALLNKIPASLFYVSTVLDLDNILTMQMRNTYELMENLLNGYINKWKAVTIILGQDAKKSTEKLIFSLIILILTVIFAIISVYAYYRVLFNVSINSEKPINLILTIKKKIFEDLKNSAESFANKLLNKFFGNEDNEEESQQDYHTNIQSNDINMIKFKSPSSGSYSCFYFLVQILQLILFLGIVEVYFIFKYVFSMDNFDSMNKFLDVYNITKFTDSDIIATVDVVKSFLYNDSIPIYEQKSIEPFITAFYEISNYLEQIVIETSKTKCFLKGEYKLKFIEYLYGDFTNLVKDDINVEEFKDDIKNGFRPILSEIYEIIRYFGFQYLSKESYFNSTRIEDTTCLLINDEYWNDLNYIVKNLLRNWFDNIEDIMDNLFSDYMSKANVVHTIIFVILQCFLLLYSIIVWRRYYITVKVMIKKSQELINLIPEEIKYIMVEKINE